MTPTLAAYGKLGTDALEAVPGWTCIRVLEIPAKAGKLAHYGECVAMAANYELARQMAAAPMLAEALLNLCAAVERIQGATNAHGEGTAVAQAKEALRFAEMGIRASATAMLGA